MLSTQALALFREHLELRRTIDVSANREAYRELARARLMVAGHSFAGGDESVYHVTRALLSLPAVECQRVSLCWRSVWCPQNPNMVSPEPIVERHHLKSPAARSLRPLAVPFMPK